MAWSAVGSRTDRVLGPVLFVALIVACLGHGAPCAAQTDAPPEAIELYRVAREDFEAGRYREAAESLERALVLDPDSPTLVYNLARVYELLGDLDNAVRQYERYQQLLPQQQAREQEQAEATIRRLQGARESSDFQPEPPPREVEPLRQLPGLVLVRENGVADAAFWVTVSGGIASLAAGAIFGGLAIDARERGDAFVLGPDGRLGQRDELLDRAQAFGIITDVTLGVGGAAIIAAGLLYFLRSHTVERAPIDAVDEPSGEATLDASLTTDGQAVLGVLRGAF